MDNQRLRPARVVLIGLGASLSGIILYALLGAIVGLGIGIVLLDIITILSLAATVGGLITTTLGVLMWAWRAPLTPLFLVAVPPVIVAFLLLQFADVNVHGPSAILLFVIVIGGAGAVLLLLVAGFRCAAALRRNRHTLSSPD